MMAVPATVVGGAVGAGTVVGSVVATGAGDASTDEAEVVGALTAEVVVGPDVGFELVHATSSDTTTRSPL
jgi:hypothetical protein